MTRCNSRDSWLLISRWKFSPMFSSTLSMLAPAGSSNSSSGICSSHLAFTAAQNSVSLSVKWLYTVSLDTPASVAMASMLQPS
ncbi:hypothetical protein D3C81_2016540 [compost metagenome]